MGQMENEALFISNRFWNLMDECKPSLKKLECALEALDKEELENYYGLYRIFCERICDYSEGPAGLSEDGAEDLCIWVVSQGFEFWQTVINKGESLEKVYQLMLDSDNGRDTFLSKWDVAVINPVSRGHQNPRDIAMAVYEHRFGEDILEIEEIIMSRLDDILSDGL